MIVLGSIHTGVLKTDTDTVVQNAGEHVILISCYIAHQNYVNHKKSEHPLFHIGIP